MKERPIIMSAESVLALLDKRKTQTRRVFKNPLIDMVGWSDGLVRFRNSNLAPLRPCPYGAPGDRLWVKETLWKNGGYVATDPPNFENEAKTPSIYCSRFWSRITLEILNVQVERLQDIDAEGATAEGANRRTRQIYHDNPRMWFIETWNCINAKRGFSWETNPFCWVIEFYLLN